jgi:hypothetical protein
MKPCIHLYELSMYVNNTGTNPRNLYGENHSIERFIFFFLLKKPATHTPAGLDLRLF